MPWLKPEMSISLARRDLSAEGAALNSRGRQAVVNRVSRKLEARSRHCDLGMICNAAPSALGTHLFLSAHGLTAVAIQCRAFGADRSPPIAVRCDDRKKSSQ